MYSKTHALHMFLWNILANVGMFFNKKKFFPFSFFLKVPAFQKINRDGML